ncbi:hypothetical protein JCM10213_004133 [Rhodosporidiobolus nylandii]
MAANETGECCVCGTETANRCGACAEAEFSLFFCSREHQKLIWPVHKRVCGPGKCSPFLWPDLTQGEADDATTHMHDPYASADGLQASLARNMYELCNISPVDLPDVILELSVGREKPPTLSLADRQLYLFALRFLECARRGTETLSKPAAMMRADKDLSDPVADAALLVKCLLSPLLPAVLTAPSTEHKAFLRRGKAAFQRYLEDEMAKTQPAVAKCAVEQFEELENSVSRDA